MRLCSPSRPRRSRAVLTEFAACHAGGRRIHARGLEDPHLQARERLPPVLGDELGVLHVKTLATVVGDRVRVRDGDTRRGAGAWIHGSCMRLAPLSGQAGGHGWAASYRNHRRNRPMSGVGCINSVRPAESANLQGESSSRTAVPPRGSHTRRRPPCPREIPLATQVRKRVRLGQSRAHAWSCVSRDHLASSSVRARARSAPLERCHLQRDRIYAPHGFGRRIVRERPGDVGVEPSRRRSGAATRSPRCAGCSAAGCGSGSRGQSTTASPRRSATSIAPIPRSRSRSRTSTTSRC
jgi:hypothetical protein